MFEGLNQLRQKTPATESVQLEAGLEFFGLFKTKEQREATKLKKACDHFKATIEHHRLYCEKEFSYLTKRLTSIQEKFDTLRRTIGERKIDIDGLSASGIPCEDFFFSAANGFIAITKLHVYSDVIKSVIGMSTDIPDSTIDNKYDVYEPFRPLGMQEWLFNDDENHTKVTNYVKKLLDLEESIMKDIHQFAACGPLIDAYGKRLISISSTIKSEKLFHVLNERYTRLTSVNDPDEFPSEAIFYMIREAIVLVKESSK